MDVSLYSAAAAMNATERWQDLVAQNLASASTPGIRQQEISFSAVQAGLASGSTGSSSNPMVIPVAGSTTNYSQGELKATGQNFDLALQGPGFFSVELPDGTKGYTRDGQFQLNKQGQLTTQQGYLVTGATGSLTFDPNNSAPITISAAGQATQGAEVKGKIALTEFGDLKSLSMNGAGYFVPTSDQADPQTATNTSVRQGFVEESNISPTIAMASMMTAMRMFESNQKVMQMDSDRMTKTITDLSGTSS